MKLKSISLLLFVLSLVVVTISITTLTMHAEIGAGDYGYVCCGTMCGGENQCKDVGSYVCCKD